MVEPSRRADYREPRVEMDHASGGQVDEDHPPVDTCSVQGPLYCASAVAIGLLPEPHEDLGGSDDDVAALEDAVIEGGVAVDAGQGSSQPTLFTPAVRISGAGQEEHAVHDEGEVAGVELDPDTFNVSTVCTIVPACRHRSNPTNRKASPGPPPPRAGGPCPTVPARRSAVRKQLHDWTSARYGSRAGAGQV